MPVRWCDSGLEDREMGVKIPRTGDSLDSLHTLIAGRRDSAIV